MCIKMLFKCPSLALWLLLLLSQVYLKTNALKQPQYRVQRVSAKLASVLGVQIINSQSGQSQEPPKSGGVHGLSHLLEERMMLKSINETGIVRLTQEIEAGIIKVHPLWVVRGFFIAIGDGLVKPMDWPLLRVIATQYSRSAFLCYGVIVQAYNVVMCLDDSMHDSSRLAW